MTDSFATAVSGWHDFYMLAGTAAATLVGLLFVAVSLKLDYLADPRHADLRRRVVNSFEGFIYVLLFALVFLIPNVDPNGIGIPLFIISLLRAISVERGAWQTARASRRTPWGRETLLAYQLPAACYLVVVGFTIPLLGGRPDTGGFDWFVAVILTLLGSAAASAWDLLLQVEQPAPDESLEEFRRK